MRVKEESERAGLKLNIKKSKIMASGPITGPGPVFPITMLYFLSARADYT